MFKAIDKLQELAAKKQVEHVRGKCGDVRSSIYMGYVSWLVHGVDGSMVVVYFIFFIVVSLLPYVAPIC